MTEAEFAGFRERATSDYADEKVFNGEWLRECALKRAAKVTDERLPEGLTSPSALLLTAVLRDTEVIGHAWVDLPGDHGCERAVWIYYIEILPEHRGRGLGGQLLGAVEEYVQQHGHHLIFLNVFERNEVAHGLYESSGYEIASRTMRKQLSDDPLRYMLDSIQPPGMP